MSATMSILKTAQDCCFIPLNGASCLQLWAGSQEEVNVFHSPKRGVMSATAKVYGEAQVYGFHFPKRGVMSATAQVYGRAKVYGFHSPKRGVMSATLVLYRNLPFLSES